MRVRGKSSARRLNRAPIVSNNGECAASPHVREGVDVHQTATKFSKKCLTVKADLPIPRLIG
jgi:hypothetical protein